MKQFMTFLSAGILAAALSGCSSTSANSEDVANNIRQALKSNGLGQVSVDQNKDKGVVTLTGTVASGNDRDRAEALAKSDAGTEVVADQIAVVVPGNESNSKAVNSDLDKGIEKNLDAALIQHSMKNVKYSVKNGVVTLTGNVRTENRRSRAAQVAKAVPNVEQVVNEIQLKNQPATSSH